MTLCSRVFGLIRDIIIAKSFGSTDIADAFFIAFKIPNFFRRLFAEGAFSQAFIPVLTEYRVHRSKQEVKQFVNRIGSLLTVALLLFVGIAMIAVSGLTTLFAPGFAEQPDKFILTRDMLRITLPYLLLISLTGFAGAVLNSYDRFAVPSITPIVLNICLIIATLVATPWFNQPIMALAWGVLVAGVLQLLFQCPFLLQLHLLPTFQWIGSDQGVKKVLRLMIPTLFSVSVSQINLLLDTLIASFLISGSVSWLYYSERLMSLPLGVLGIAISTVILPHLSKHHTNTELHSFSITLDWSIRVIILIGMPAVIALLWVGKPILSTLFQYGEMSVFDINMTTLSLATYSCGLIAFMLIKVLTSGFYARHNTTTPVRIGIIAIASNMVLSIGLALPLHHYYQLGHVGLALSTSLAAWINALTLLWLLRRQNIYTPTANWQRFTWQLLFASVCLILLLWSYHNIWHEWDNWRLWQRLWRLSIICSSGLLIYLGGLWLTGWRIRDLQIKP